MEKTKKLTSLGAIRFSVLLFRWKFISILSGILSLIFITSFILVNHTQAASFVYVRVDGDDALCSGLDDAPASAAPNCAKETITVGIATVDEPGFVYISSGTFLENLVIDKDVTLSGSGRTWTLIDAGGSGHAVVVNSGKSVTLRSLGIQGGNPSTSEVGGGLDNRGTVILERCAVRNNTADAGGGLVNYGAMTIDMCDIHGNSATTTGGGGGILNFGGLSIIDSRIYDNHANTVPNSDGGGIFNGGSTGTIMLLKRVSVFNNTAARVGAGIKDQTAGTSILANVTVHNNASGDGAGVSTTFSGSMTILNSTIAGNHTNLGIVGGLQTYANVNIENSMVAGNTGYQCGGDVVTHLSSDGHNLSSDSTCGFTNTGDQQNTAPLLGVFQDHGGYVETIGLLTGSPAIDTAAISTCSSILVEGIDARGVLRPIDGDQDGSADCDIGAFEKMIDLFLPLIMR